MDYELFIDQIKAGKLPSTTGLHFSGAQVEEIEIALKERKNEISDYFTGCIETRLEE